MENKKWRLLGFVLTCLIFLLIGYSAGFTKGVIKGAEWAVIMGMNFVDINLNEEEIIDLVRTYQRYCGTHYLGECLDTWNKMKL